MVSKVQCYDPSENRWSIKARCPQPWRYRGRRAGQPDLHHGRRPRGSGRASACRRLRAASGRGWGHDRQAHVSATRWRRATSSTWWGATSAQRWQDPGLLRPHVGHVECVTTVPYSLIPTAFVQHLEAPARLRRGASQVSPTPRGAHQGQSLHLQGRLGQPGSR